MCTKVHVKMVGSTNFFVKSPEWCRLEALRWVRGCGHDIEWHPELPRRRCTLKAAATL